MENTEPNLKTRTARTIKWNAIDSTATQLGYAVVGIVLANVLTPADFGLVGALAIFQAFAIIFVDSGFGAALLQLPSPTDRDYSTVFWFNLLVSILIYLILFISAPAIAWLFQDNQALIPLSKVMFLTFVLNGLSIVQVNRLMKRMDVRMIAVSNVSALCVSGAVGISLALLGYGPWALVWQQLTMSGVKTLILWISERWVPTLTFSRESFSRIWRVGLSVFSSSMLNTICLNAYNFVIGIFYSLPLLGIYTQADKWSKMGSATLTQLLTASFVPMLASARDDAPRFKRYISKTHRFAAFITLPALGGMALVGAPLFHTLFGAKWDAAIILFQILCIRGIFAVFTGLYTRYLLALGHARTLFIAEVIKDVCIFGAILATVWFGSISLLVWGQLWAGLITWAITLLMTCRNTGITPLRMLHDLLPFTLLTLLMCASAMGLGTLLAHTGTLLASAPAQLLLQAAVGALTYLVLLRLCRIPELSEALSYLLRRKS